MITFVLFIKYTYIMQTIRTTVLTTYPRKEDYMKIHLICLAAAMLGGLMLSRLTKKVNLIIIFKFRY